MMRHYHDSGYSPLPLGPNSRPVVGGWLGGMWRYRPTDDERYSHCGIGLQCCARPLTGGVSLDAVRETWIAPVILQSHDKALLAAMLAIVTKHAGVTPTRADGNRRTILFRIDEAFRSRTTEGVYLPSDKPAAISFTPHRASVLSRGEFVVVSGGTWANGGLPETRRDALPLITVTQADAIMVDIEKLFDSKGARTWR